MAREHGLRTHLDGARLMNAVVASGVARRGLRRRASTPPGSTSRRGSARPWAPCSRGSSELIAEAWRWKQMMGGAMRQSGIVAAGCLHALDHHVERLAEDHENARVLADGLARARLRGARARDEHRDLRRARRIRAGAWRERGVELSGTPDGRVRAVTHLDVDRAGVDSALEAARALLA